VQLSLFKGRVLSAPGSGSAEIFSDAIPLGDRDRVTFTVYVEYGWIVPPAEPYLLNFLTQVSEDLTNFVTEQSGPGGDISSPESADLVQFTGAVDATVTGAYARVAVSLENGSVSPSSIAAVSIRVDARIDHK